MKCLLLAAVILGSLAPHDLMMQKSMAAEGLDPFSVICTPDGLARIGEDGTAVPIEDTSHEICWHCLDCAAGGCTTDVHALLGQVLLGTHLADNQRAIHFHKSLLSQGIWQQPRSRSPPLIS